MKSWITTLPIAHRGLHDIDEGIPENSLAAFDAARDAGLPAELDVRLLRDGSVAVFHDEDLERMTGRRGAVAQITRDDAAGLKLAGTPERLALLADVLDLIDGRTPLLIEIKNLVKPGDLERAVYTLLRSYTGEFAVQSFNPFSLEWFRQFAPSIARGQLGGDFRDVAMPWYRRAAYRYLLMNVISRPTFIGYDVRSFPFRRVASLRGRGMPVLGWTVRDERERERVRPHCDNIIFEGFTPAPPQTNA